MKKITSEHNNPSGSGYKCAECNNLFTSREGFMAHMKQEHGKVSDWSLNDYEKKNNISINRGNAYENKK